jgi:translation initiation factor IF-2
MSEVTKAVRLSKIAREFNVGISTIVEYLEGEGIKVDNNPNTKIEANVYNVLLEEFQADKQKKEKSQQTSISRTEREVITLESKKTQVVKPEEEEPEIDLSIFQKSYRPPIVPEKTAPPAEKKEEPVKEPVKEEVKEKPVEAKAETEAKTEAEVKKEPVAEKEAPVEEKKAEEKKGSGLKVIGKVDLDAIAPKKSTVKSKAEKAKAKAAEEEKKNAQKKANDNAVKAKEEEKPVAPERVQPEILKTQFEKLSGPTVLGKIELPKIPEKKKRQPVASSSDPDLKKKRKRKRIPTPGESKPTETRRPAAPARGEKGKTVKPDITQKDIQKEIKETLARLSGGGKSKSAKLRRAKRDAVAQRAEEEQQRVEDESTVLKLTEFVTVSELATLMNASVNDVISACMSLGIMVSINQRLDAETIQVIAEEFGYEVEFVSAAVQESIPLEEDDEEDLIPRPPIVTVMGHVDHGKTSLLDYIRKANVIEGEAGGITQHIGAYNVELKDGKTITFLDTPGHEAFTAMRARGAQVTDLAIIVVSADDGVMPQTKEAINHAQAAGIPMIFAINKIDKEDANPDRIKEELSAMNILIEEWGGKYQSQDISAKKGTNIDELLEKVSLEAELLELKANPDKRALGTVIESSLDKGRGYVCSLLVEAGTLRVGDSLLAGQWSGRVKAMYNERGTRVEDVGPAMPVSILGLNGAPSAGDKFYVLEDEREARNIATKRQQLQREQGVRTQKHITIEEIGRRIAIGEFKELNLIIKGDVDGSIEALSDSLQKLSTEKIQVNIIHKAVGQISESDVLLASASDAIIIGFQVRPSANARKLAEREEIQIRLYSVIYHAIEEMKEAMEGMLSAKIEEKILGTAEVREAFKISKVGTIAGCIVLDGKINRNSKVRLIRDGIVFYTGLLGSLKRFKDDVKEVTKGFECGLNIEKFNDIKEGDQIEAFEEVEVKQTL